MQNMFTRVESEEWVFQAKKVTLQLSIIFQNKKMTICNKGLIRKNISKKFNNTRNILLGKKFQIM